MNYAQMVSEAIIEKAAYNLQGHKDFHGLKISIENKAGSIRRGTDSDGTSWQTKMHHDYGYILGTKGKDKDHVDCFVGKGTGGQVFVVHQHNIGIVKNWDSLKCPTCGELPKNCPHAYDEDKVMLGFDSKGEAIKAYLSNYDTKLGLGIVDEMGIEECKKAAKKTFEKPGKITSRMEKKANIRLEYLSNKKFRIV